MAHGTRQRLATPVWAGLLGLLLALAGAEAQAEAPSLTLACGLAAAIGQGVDEQAFAVEGALPLAAPLVLDADALATDGPTSASASQYAVGEGDETSGSVSVTTGYAIDSDGSRHVFASTGSSIDLWTLELAPAVPSVLRIEYAHDEGMSLSLVTPTGGTVQFPDFDGVLEIDLEPQVVQAVSVRMHAGLSISGSGVTSASDESTAVFHWQLAPEPDAALLAVTSLAVLAALSRPGHRKRARVAR